MFEGINLAQAAPYFFGVIALLAFAAIVAWACLMSLFEEGK